MRKNVTVVCGGQYGSEGKGKVSKFLAETFDMAYAVRVGGPNSGHTVYDSDGGKHILRCVPAAVIDNEFIQVIIPPGSYIDEELLLEEINSYRLHGRIHIHPNASIITTDDKLQEKRLCRTIASTGSGTGSSMIRRIARTQDATIARDSPALKPYLDDTVELLAMANLKGQRVIIEGTQGYGLSIFHTECYPYATARDTTASGFLSETGISPCWVEHIALVFRTFPIRVGGCSGPMENEIGWDDVTTYAGANTPIKEYTSVTRHLRRVSMFDPVLAKKAVLVNTPDIVVLNHLDYVPESKRRSFITGVVKGIGIPVDYVGLDPQTIKVLLD